MKTNLQLSGMIELSRQEISEAIIEFLKYKHQYNATRVVFEIQESKPGVPDSLSLKAVVEVKGLVTNTTEKIPEYKLPEVRHKQQATGYHKVNIGVYDVMRSLLNERFVMLGSVNPTTMFPTKNYTIDSFLKDVQVFCPNLQIKYLRTYMCDKRQFGTNYSWDGYRDELIMRDTFKDPV